MPTWQVEQVNNLGLLRSNKRRLLSKRDAASKVIGGSPMQRATAITPPDRFNAERGGNYHGET